MTIPGLLALLVAQQPGASAPDAFPITRVEIAPSVAEIQVGQTVRLAARALDGAGQPVAGAKIVWLTVGLGGDVDSAGLVTGGYVGHLRVTALGFIQERNTASRAPRSCSRGSWGKGRPASFSTTAW